MTFSLISANSVVQNTTTETAIFSQLLPADLMTVGRIIQTRFLGYYSAAAVAPTITLRLRLGTSLASSVVLGTATATAVASLASNFGFLAETFSTVRTLGTAGKIITQGKLEYAIGLSAQNCANLVNTAEVTVNWSTNLTLYATVQMSGANVANVITTTNGALVIE